MKATITGSSRLLSEVGALMLVACVVAATDGRAQSAPRILAWEGSATAIENLILRAGNGSLTVTAAETDRVRISLEVSPKRWTDDESGKKVAAWFLTSGNATDAELIASIALQVKDRGEDVEISLRPGGRTRASRVNEAWTIEVPARLTVAAEMDAAVVSVAGIAGGFRLRLGHGKADLDLAGGDLDLKVTVGELSVRTRGDYGDIDLRSTVGDTELWLGGLRIDYPDPPGAGSKVAVGGEGTLRAHVEVEVGDAELRIN